MPIDMNHDAQPLLWMPCWGQDLTVNNMRANFEIYGNGVLAVGAAYGLPSGFDTGGSICTYSFNYNIGDGEPVGHEDALLHGLSVLPTDRASPCRHCQGCVVVFKNTLDCDRVRSSCTNTTTADSRKVSRTIWARACMGALWLPFRGTIMAMYRSYQRVSTECKCQSMGLAGKAWRCLWKINLVVRQPCRDMEAIAPTNSGNGIWAGHRQSLSMQCCFSQ